LTGESRAAPLVIFRIGPEATIREPAPKPNQMGSNRCAHGLFDDRPGPVLRT
jgi:hypothetical protein